MDITRNVWSRWEDQRHRCSGGHQQVGLGGAAAFPGLFQSIQDFP